MAINRFLQSSVQSGLPKFDRVWDGISAVGSMDAISSVTLTANQTTIEFNNIPQTYSHLQIRGFILGSTSTGYDTLIRFNADTGNNYSWNRVGGNGSSTFTSSTGATGAMYFDNDNARDTYPTSTVLEILDYSNTNKTRVIRTLTGYERNGSGAVQVWSGFWNNTNALTSIQISPTTGSIAQYSKISLYGIK